MVALNPPVSAATVELRTSTNLRSLSLLPAVYTAVVSPAYEIAALVALLSVTVHSRVVAGVVSLENSIKTRAIIAEVMTVIASIACPLYAFGAWITQALTYARFGGLDVGFEHAKALVSMVILSGYVVAVAPTEQMSTRERSIFGSAIYVVTVLRMYFAKASPPTHQPPHGLFPPRCPVYQPTCHRVRLSAMGFPFSFRTLPTLAF